MKVGVRYGTQIQPEKCKSYRFMWFSGLLDLSKALSLHGRFPLPICEEGAGCPFGLNISPSGSGKALARRLFQAQELSWIGQPPRRRQAAPSWCVRFFSPRGHALQSA